MAHEFSEPFGARAGHVNRYAHAAELVRLLFDLQKRTYKVHVTFPSENYRSPLGVLTLGLVWGKNAPRNANQFYAT